MRDRHLLSERDMLQTNVFLNQRPRYLNQVITRSSNHQVRRTCSLKSANAIEKYCERRRREISHQPYLSLDAPGLRDDFYLNILDWSLSNIISVALDSVVYSYNLSNGETNSPIEASSLSSDLNSSTYISSIKTMGLDSKYLAAASSTGCIAAVDLETKKCLFNPFSISQDRISALESMPFHSPHILLAGSFVGDIYSIDIREPQTSIKQSAALSRQMKTRSVTKKQQQLHTEGHFGKNILKFHQKEVCGLKLSPNNNNWLASGGNDNTVCIWDLRKTIRPMSVQQEHKAAIKALAWCPQQRSLLATGAGTNDRRIQCWNVLTEKCIRQVQTDSQISALSWTLAAGNGVVSELISAHGFVSNSIKVWHYPTMTLVDSIAPAHSSRLLHMAMGHSEQDVRVATTAANESVKFWSLNNSSSSASFRRFPRRRSVFDL